MQKDYTLKERLRLFATIFSDDYFIYHLGYQRYFYASLSLHKEPLKQYWLLKGLVDELRGGKISKDKVSRNFYQLNIYNSIGRLYNISMNLNLLLQSIEVPFDFRLIKNERYYTCMLKMFEFIANYQNNYRKDEEVLPNDFQRSFLSFLKSPVPDVEKLFFLKNLPIFLKKYIRKREDTIFSLVTVGQW